MGKTIDKDTGKFLPYMANVSLLLKMGNQDFFNTDYYKNLNLDPNYKSVLEGYYTLGNPAMAQMMLYSLLSSTKQAYDNDQNNSTYQKIKKDINDFVEENKIDAKSDYKSDKLDGKLVIDYYRHMRNSISHFRCEYKEENGMTVVIFNDKYNKETCYIKMKYADMAGIIFILLRNLEVYYNSL